MNAPELLDVYVKAVMTASQTQSLTAARDADEFRSRHVVDAQKLLEFFPDNSADAALRLLDIGSGNGIPGMVFAILRPTWQIVLLDSNTKKALFLDTFIKSNGIKNAAVLCDRAEILARKPDLRATFDLVTARALSKLPVALELSSPFLKLGGLLIVPHGTSHEEELERSKKAMKELGVVLKEKNAYKLNSGPEFTALTFQKEQNTPDTYPRRVGIPDKRPL